ncbi:sensor histidine kinase [Sphingopyxis sp. JAI128]|uniref:sensor histidine kinase n=1 Tax=Sphingopyxis sp. JAI128 TaxID=2723066 RepID=UPI0016206866|nr:sensor histidine kinase [Sphingopyxis sp. JAI128]MBB6428167.1 signal transduction histidine kinase [Sphingopyxis sp. JAI128]
MFRFSLLLLLFLHGIPALAAEPLVVGNAPVDLAGHLDVLEDETGKLTLGDVALGAERHKFRTVRGSYNGGFAKRGSVWIRFRLVSAGPIAGRDTERFLVLNPSNLDKVRVYVAKVAHPRSPLDFESFLTGAGQPYELRPIPNPGFVVPVELRGEPQLVLVKIEGRALQTLRASIETRQSLTGIDMALWLFAGAYLCACIIVAGINSAFWFWLRERYYLLYAAYALSLALIGFWRAGLLVMLLPRSAHDLYFPFQGAASGLSAAIGMLFLASYLQLRTIAPHTFRLIGMIIAVSLAFAVAIFVDQGHRLLMPLALVGVALVTIVMLQVVRLAVQGSRRARIYLLSFTPVNVAVIALIARNLGWIPTSALIEYGFQIGGLLHLVTMTIGLGSRIDRAERERRDAEQRALFTAQAAERHAQRIADLRTRELQVAKSDLETALAAEQRVSREQLQFIDTVSHEYRTPVAVLRTNLDLLRMAKGKGASPSERSLKRMGDAISRLTEIIEISLRSDRISSESVTSTKIAVEPGSLVEDAIHIARNVHAGRSVVYRADEGCGRIAADVPMLKTALANVIDNALKYSPDDSEVHVRLHPAGDRHLSISVADEGIGISEKDRPFIFDKYYRAAGAAKRAGAGIGLHLVQTIVKAHGGEIELASSGAGTEFRIILPVDEQP